MKVIFLNMSSQFEWDNGIYNRNKHILDEFSKRDDVEKILSVDFLPYNLKSCLRLYLKSKIYKKAGKGIISSGLFYSAKKINDKVISLSAINMKIVKNVADKLGFGNAVIINYSPFNIKHFEYFKENKKYFDAVDNWSENNTFKEYKDVLLANYKYIIENSIITFTRPEKLKDNLEKIAYCDPKTQTAMVCNKIKNNIKVVLNGVDLNHYMFPKKIDRIDDIFNKLDKNKTKIGYLGVIKEDRIDSNLLEYIVENNDDKIFIMAGPIVGNFNSERFKKFNNIIFIGEASYQEMSYLYSKFDICIIPHLLNDFIKSMDPMKIYGYLAAGKPIISVPVPGTEQFEDLIDIAYSKEDFSEAIKRNSNDNDVFSEYQKKERQDAVKADSWESRVNEMINLINCDIIK